MWKDRSCPKRPKTALLSTLRTGASTPGARLDGLVAHLEDLPVDFLATTSERLGPAVTKKAPVTGRCLGVCWGVFLPGHCRGTVEPLQNPNTVPSTSTPKRTLRSVPPSVGEGRLGLAGVRHGDKTPPRPTALKTGSNSRCREARAQTQARSWGRDTNAMIPKWRKGETLGIPSRKLSRFILQVVGCGKRSPLPNSTFFDPSRLRR